MKIMKSIAIYAFSGKKVYFESTSIPILKKYDEKIMLNIQVKQGLIETFENLNPSVNLSDNMDLSNITLKYIRPFNNKNYHFINRLKLNREDGAHAHNIFVVAYQMDRVVGQANKWVSLKNIKTGVNVVNDEFVNWHNSYFG